MIVNAQKPLPADYTEGCRPKQVQDPGVCCHPITTAALLIMIVGVLFQLGKQWMSLNVLTSTNEISLF